MPMLAKEVIKERAKRLREKGDAALRAHLERQQGRRLTVLSESKGVARAEDFTQVRIATAPAGHLLDICVSGHDGQMLLSA